MSCGRSSSGQDQSVGQSPVSIGFVPRGVINPVSTKVIPHGLADRSVVKKKTRKTRTRTRNLGRADSVPGIAEPVQLSGYLVNMNISISALILTCPGLRDVRSLK